MFCLPVFFQVFVVYITVLAVLAFVLLPQGSLIWHLKNNKLMHKPQVTLQFVPKFWCYHIKSPLSMFVLKGCSLTSSILVEQRFIQSGFCPTEVDRPVLDVGANAAELCHYDIKFPRPQY